MLKFIYIFDNLIVFGIFFKKMLDFSENMCYNLCIPMRLRTIPLHRKMRLFFKHRLDKTFVLEKELCQFLLIGYSKIFLKGVSKMTAIIRFSATYFEQDSMCERIWKHDDTLFFGTPKNNCTTRRGCST